MPNTNQLKSKISAVQLSAQGLLKLLGGTADDRERFWEIVKGITTPAEFRLVNSQLVATAAALKQAQAGLKEIEAAAKQIAR